MPNLIVSAQPNIQGGLFNQLIQFEPGLNILSGENGTFKTKLLQSIKNNNAIHYSQPTQPFRVQAFSPKRNAQRRAYQDIAVQFRRDNIEFDGLTNERGINDGSFEQYPALGELFHTSFVALCKDGGNQIEKMNAAKATFNEVIQKIFPRYELVANWTPNGPAVSLLKNANIQVPLEGLSLGEQEILSLVANIASSREKYDIFLIDEPEVHLNWNLEQKLFEFFDDFCRSYAKQLIVVTHSRVIFTQRFFGKCQFLYWSDAGTVSVSKDLSHEQRRRIAGDAIEIIRMGQFSKPTFFVEDLNHVKIVQELANALRAEISIVECDNKANVRSMHRLAKLDGNWRTSYFLEDGDGEGNPNPQDPHFIHLDKYCLDNYLLDIDVIAAISGNTAAAVKEHIFKAILASRTEIFKKNRFFEFLIEHLTAEHLNAENLAKLDVSLIMPALFNNIRMNENAFIQAYVNELKVRELLATVFPRTLIGALQEAIPQPVAQEIVADLPAQQAADALGHQ